jgi:oxaloacetate decarboxylase (Na+ extruding) subunit alpha
MISNLRSQLAQQDALDRLPEVLAELPRCRADMGYPPLVTPTSQIVGVQAVLNVLSGKRYDLITEETRNYVKGEYGRAPAPIDPVLKRKVLGKSKPITCRPADMLQPMLPTATQGIPAGLIESEEDVISYCLFPEQALDYFHWRALPTEERPTTPADLELKQQTQSSTATVAAPPPAPAKRFLTDQDYRELGLLIDKVAALKLSEFTIRRNDINVSLKAAGFAGGPISASDAAATEAPALEPTPADPTAEPAPADAAPRGPTVNAPLNGTFYRSAGPGQPKFAEEGATLKKDAPVCIVEAMKLFNQIKVPRDCKIVKFLANHGDAVTKGQPLVEIDPSSAA